MSSVKESSIVQLITELVDVASSVKTSLSTRDFSGIKGQIERWQTLGNRLETELETQRDIEDYRKKIRKLKKEIVKLENEIDDLVDSKS